MFTVVIEARTLHEEIWKIIKRNDACKYIESLVNRESVTLDLFKSAVYDIFYSESENPEADIVNSFSVNFNLYGLYKYAVSKELVAVEKHASIKRKDGVIDIDNACELREILPPLTDLVYMIFEDELDEITAMIYRTISAELKGKCVDWRYRCVEFDAHTTRDGKILGLKLLIGQDIRHLLYKELFPNGRYDSTVLKNRDISEPYRGFERDRLTGVVRHANRQKG